MKTSVLYRHVTANNHKNKVTKMLWAKKRKCLVQDEIKTRCSNM